MWQAGTREEERKERVEVGGSREGLAGRPLDAFAQKLARAISDANVFHVRAHPSFGIQVAVRPTVTPAHSLGNPGWW